MAKKVTVIEEFTDDLDGTKAQGTTTFAIDGKTYEIDLSKKNRTALDKALKPYVDAARTVRGTRTTRGSGARNGKRSDLGEIRSWARGNGYDVSDRGRIPAIVIEAFDAR